MAWCAARYGAGMTRQVFRLNKLARPSLATLAKSRPRRGDFSRAGLFRSWQQPRRDQAPTVFTLLVALCTAGALALINVALILAAVNLTQKFSAFVPGHRNLALDRGRWLFALEQHLHIGLEPLVQQRLLQGIATPWGMISGAALRTAAVWVYTHAYPTWLIAALVWTYLFRRYRFGVLRDLTIISGFLVVACYRFLPTAPPRFILSGAPYYLQDWTHGGAASAASTASVIGFNPFAAFPSSHVLWALIPAVCLLRGCRILWVWLVGLLFPLVMFLTVVATGNHYVLDAVGAVVVLTVSYLLAQLLAVVRHELVRLVRFRPPSPYTGADFPAALALSLACAGGLAFASSSFQVRSSVAAAILLAIVLAVVQNNRLVRQKGRSQTDKTKWQHYHYLSGLFFVAGATSALRAPGLDTRVCALLWLLASLSALAAHTRDPRQVFPRGWRTPPGPDDVHLRRRLF